MIKLDDTSEISESKSDISKSYLNIQPKEKLSDQELADSVSKEFADVHSIARFDAYDHLISEIFNRSEDEICIDFSFTDEINVLLKDFKPEKWECLQDPEKTEQISRLTKAIGDALELDHIPRIKILEGDDAYGFYDPKDNSITLNSRYLYDPVELVNTVAHELRHAYQHMRANALETWEDALYKVNFDNYISPLPLPGGGFLFYTDYYDQYVEVEARVFANKFTEAMI